MAYVDECTFWPLLRLVELHRFDTNYETCYVVPALGRSQKFYLGESPSASWDLTERSGVHGELDPFSEALALQREGRDIELVRWAQIIRCKLAEHVN
jgi:hypothetical protein